MSVVHLVRQGAQAHLAQGRLEVRAEGEVLLRVPLGQVRAVVVWGNVGLTTPLLTALAERGIAVTFMTRRGRFRARLEGRSTPHVALRRLQYAATRHERWLVPTAMPHKSPSPTPPPS